MPSTPYAKLLVSLNAGATQSGGITGANSDTVALTAESTAQWNLDTPPKWEIYSYPDGWTGPASGWTTESVAQPFGGTADIYVYYGLGPPPSFTLPALPLWGKFLFRLTVQGGILSGRNNPNLIDDTTAVQIESPNGLVDTATLEGTQFSLDRAWSGPLQENWRTIDGFMTTAGTVTSVSGTAPIAVANGTTTPAISITAATALAAGSMSAAHFSLVNGATSANTANTLVKRDASGNATVSTLFTGTVDTPGTDLVLAADSSMTITLDITSTNNVVASAPVQAPSFKLVSQINLSRSIPLYWSSCKVGGVDSWDISDVSDLVCTVQDAFANLSIECRFVHGSHLTAVSVWNTGPGTGGDPLPANAPSFTLYRKLLSTGIASVIGTINATLDGTYRGTRRETTIDLSAGSGHTVDAVLYRYYLVITPEFGADSLPGHKVSAAETDYFLPSGFVIGQD